MRSKILLLTCVMMLAGSGAAWALPANGPALTSLGDDLRFSVNFAGLEIDYGTVTFDVGAPVVVGTGGAIGYVPAAFYPSPGVGLPGGLFVFFNSAGTVLADVDATGASSSPGVVPNLGAMLTNPANVFMTYGVGVIDNVQNPDGTVVSFPETYPGAPATTQQLTFVVRDLQLTISSPTPASFEASIDGGTGFGTGTLTTSFAANTGIISIFEDAITDVDSRAVMIPAMAGAPAGELPTAFFDPNTTGGPEYFDPLGGALSPFRYADPSDAMETEVLRLTHTGGMLGTDVFNADLRTPAGPNVVTHPTLGALTVWTGGRTGFSDPSASLFITGGSWAGTILDPGVGFRITSDVAFGLTQTGTGGADPGVLPEDPDTFTFQTPLGGGPEIFGGSVIIPEPLTMMGLVMGGSALAGYLRKRRA